jgi:ABC-2 type transport system permease protein
MPVTTHVLRSEWTKLRSVRSTVWTLSVAVVVTVALGTLISALSKDDYDRLAPPAQLTFDPTFTSFSGMGLGQLALIVFGVLVVSTEYSTGLIRTSLAAVPQRATFLLGKIAVATLLACVVGMATAFAAFFAGQEMLAPHGASLDDPGVLRAVLGGGLYMTLIATFSMGVTAMLRSPLLSLGILMPFFFLISTILSHVHATRAVGQYLPDQAGEKIMQVVTVGSSAPYGPWGGFAIMCAWVAAAVLGGLAVLKTRDA